MIKLELSPQEVDMVLKGIQRFELGVAMPLYNYIIKESLRQTDPDRMPDVCPVCVAYENSAMIAETYPFSPNIGKAIAEQIRLAMKGHL